jgi:hypothetical protein
MNVTYTGISVSEEHTAYIYMIEVDLMHISSSTQVAKYKDLRGYNAV